MAKVFPFKALMYDPGKVGNLEKVVTQPYDKITEAMREGYYAASPFNLARIIRGKVFPSDTETDNVYTRAEKQWSEWKSAGVVRSFPYPALFAYFQEYEIPGSPGTRRTRKGFIGLGKLEDYSAGIIFPHEETLRGPKEDRLKLLRQTRAHFGQIFMLYGDPARTVDSLLDRVAQALPQIRVTDEYGVAHSVWAIEDRETLDTICPFMCDKKLVIADGHHRYETSLTFRNECRTAKGVASGELPPYEKVMMTFINMENEGLTILPTHRLVSHLSEFNFKRFFIGLQEMFHLTGFKFFTRDEKVRKLAEFRQELEAVGEVIHTIGMYAGGTSNFYLLKLKGTLDLSQWLPGISPRQHGLDVVLLHKLILERGLGISEADMRSEKNVRYIREFEAGIEAVDRREAQLGFFLNSTPLNQVRDIAFAGERLPQKSTDFYPKLLSGLTMYSIDPADDCLPPLRKFRHR